MFDSFREVLGAFEDAQQEGRAQEVARAEEKARRKAARRGVPLEDALLVVEGWDEERTFRVILVVRPHVMELHVPLSPMNFLQNVPSSITLPLGPLASVSVGRGVLTVPVTLRSGGETFVLSLDSRVAPVVVATVQGALARRS